MADAFDDREYDEEEEKLHGMYLGTVVERDPELKRVKVEIEGLIDKSPWAYPIGAAAGGSSGVGLVGTPRDSATVHIWFANGDRERPFYAPGYWGEGEIPDEAKDKPDATIWSSENFAILMDDSEGDKILKLINRKTNDFIELNANDNSITINGTTAISITALGMIDITAAKVQINGRIVAPIAAPI